MSLDDPPLPQAKRTLYIGIQSSIQTMLINEIKTFLFIHWTQREPFTTLWWTTKEVPEGIRNFVSPKTPPVPEQSMMPLNLKDLEYLKVLLTSSQKSRRIRRLRDTLSETVTPILAKIRDPNAPLHSNYSGSLVNQIGGMISEIQPVTKVSRNVLHMCQVCREPHILSNLRWHNLLPFISILEFETPVSDFRSLSWFSALW